jgi:HPt (histidine-containing phosphotransfer) domain-containing protein
MPAGETQTFDLEALVERLDGDLRLARELVETYLEESPAMRAGIREALRRHDASRLFRAAHALRGALAAVAAPGAERLSHRLESEARRGEVASEPAAALETELDRLEQALRSYLREAS